MVKFKGRFFFRQYMPKKPVKYGLKVWALCESGTGYCLNWSVYTGGREIPGDYGLGYDVVRTISSDFMNKGHHIYMDNFFTSPKLLLDMEDDGTGCCGTVRPQRVGMPPGFQEIRLRRGDPPVFKQSGNLMAVNWHDVKRVKVLSSVHEEGVVQKEIRDRNAPNGIRNVDKPTVISKCNAYIGGVDTFDQLLQSYEYQHKSQKWYMPLYHRVREIALVNGFILYKTVNPDSNKTSKEFRYDVIDGLLDGTQSSRKRPGQRSQNPTPARLTERHFGRAPKKGFNPDCVVCSDRNIKRVQTSHGCRECDQAMCWPRCFEIYHTIDDYKRAGREMRQRLANDGQ
ncbi:piggyBac transposable element-derived protein 4-like [Lineus longissimus]|uniref:piggyBac transposable element-derived protein 4-like n=1 Tax=Lineus longissimus TaxID=88925 RepID=UPI00315C74BB